MTRQGSFVILIGLAVFLFSQTGYSQKKEKLLVCKNASSLFTNATFITLDPKKPLASAVAVNKQRLLAIGDKAALIANCRGKDTQVIDLKGAFVVPGFIDTHSKFILYGWLSEHALDLSTTNVFQRADWRAIKNTDAFLDTLENKTPGANGWLVVNGYDPVRMKGTPLNQAMLNNLNNNNIPTIVFYSSGDQALLNQAGIQKIAMLNNTKQIHIDNNGIIQDKSLQILLTELINKEAATKAIQTAARQYAQQGYTTVTEALVTPAWTPNYEQLSTLESFPVDVILTPSTFTEKKRMDLTYQDNPRLYVGPVLVQVDGAAQEGAAFLTLPSLQPTLQTNHNWPEPLKKSPRELEQILITANKEKTPIALQCDGDAAIDLVLNLITKLQNNPTPALLNAIIINAPYVRNDQLQRMQQLKVRVSWFAPHFYYWGNALCNIFRTAQGPYQSPLANAKKIMNNLSVQANSPSTPPIPLQMMKFISSGERQSWLPVSKHCASQKLTNEQISLPDALKALTLDAALLYGLEGDKGSLIPGKLADMTILSGNPLQSNNFKNIKVLGTIYRGILHLNDSINAASEPNQDLQ